MPQETSDKRADWKNKVSSNWQTRDDIIVLMSHIGAHWRLSILIHGQDKEGASARGDC